MVCVWSCTRLQSQLVAKMGLDSRLLTQQDTASSPPCANYTLDIWCRIIITLEFTGNDFYLPALAWLLNRVNLLVSGIAISKQVIWYIFQ